MPRPTSRTRRPQPDKLFRDAERLAGSRRAGSTPVRIPCDIWTQFGTAKPRIQWYIRSGPPRPQQEKAGREMGFRIESTRLGGVVVVIPDVFEDDRGFFLEAFRADHFKALGLPHEFVQENHSGSRKGVLRGLHFQWDPPMGKLMRVALGRAFLVAVDIRKGSPTLGEWVGREVTAESRERVWAPAGFARGFCALSERAEVQYLCTAIYNPKGESGIRWDDPDIGIQWPACEVPWVLSQKDREAQPLAQWLSSPHAESFSY